MEQDWLASQIEDADSTDATRDEEEESTDATQDEEVRMDAESTDATRDEEEDSTDATQDEEIRMDADSTELTRDEFAGGMNAGQVVGSKIPSSEIIVRTIAVERSAPLVDLPADADAAFGQWLGNSGLAPSKH